MIAPLYIGEISDAASRGKRVSINQLNIVIGLSAAYFTNYFILELSHSELSWVSAVGLDVHTWRWMLGLEILPASVFFLALFTIPNPPRWLMLKGRKEQAKQVARKLFPAEQVEQQLTAMEQSAQQQMPSLWQRLCEVFGSKMRLALIIGVIVGVTQQITGINAIFFYAPTIFEQSGIGTNAAFAQAVMVGVINVIFTLVAMSLIDRWGRKPLLIVGLSGIMLSMAVCTYGFATATYTLSNQGLTKIEAVEGIQHSFDPQSLVGIVDITFDNDLDFKHAVKDAIGMEAARDHESLLISNSIDINATLILLGILGFVASFAVSLGPVMWVLFSEIFPNHLRGIAISVVGFINSMVSFGVQFIFPLELTTIGAALTFATYAVFAAIGLVLIMRLLPETKGKSLEELETLLAKH
jgi:MFS family permease